MNFIAWGDSKFLRMYLERIDCKRFKYCIDSNPRSKDICGVKVVDSTILDSFERGTFRVVIFAASSGALQSISKELGRKGLVDGIDYVTYSDFFLESFSQKILEATGKKFDPSLYQYVRSFNLNSVKPVHTSVLGNYFFLESLRLTSEVPGSIVEVGAFEGGNALCALSYCLAQKGERRKYYIIDSFEGFPDLNEKDPAKFKKGDYKTSSSFQEITNSFKSFTNVEILKGFVPDIFAALPEEEKYSLVFYDCDLYEPALDTFEYFWSRLSPGGVILIHDHETEVGGFTGVKEATSQFFVEKHVSVYPIWESTMAIVKKQNDNN